MSFYSLAADAMVAFHAAYVGFVVFGLLAILIGILCHWRWIGNFWFRIIHFVMMAVVVAEALAGVICPLTTWEDDLREMAGEPPGEGTFVGRLCDAVMFYRPTVDEDLSSLSDEESQAAVKKSEDALQRKLTIAYCVVGGVILLTLILAPPRAPRWLVHTWERRSVEARYRRLRLNVWLSPPDVGRMARFLFRRGRTDTIQSPPKRP